MAITPPTKIDSVHGLIAWPPNCSPAISISDATRPEHSARNQGQQLFLCSASVRQLVFFTSSSSCICTQLNTPNSTITCSLLLFNMSCYIFIHPVFSIISSMLQYHACGSFFFHHVPATTPWAAVDRWVPAGNARKSMPRAGRLDGVSFRQSSHRATPELPGAEWILCEKVRVRQSEALKLTTIVYTNRHASLCTCRHSCSALLTAEQQADAGAKITAA